MENKRKNKFLFLLIFCLFIFFIFFPNLIQAKEIPNPKFEPQVAIPEATINGQKIEPGVEIEITPQTFAYYLLEVYKWGLRVLALLAIVMIMIAGGRWIIAGGNASTIKQAKDQIIGALIGLLIGFGSYAILNFINPSLVNLNSLNLEIINPKTISTCSDCAIDEICFYNPGQSELFGEDWLEDVRQGVCLDSIKIWAKTAFLGGKGEINFKVSSSKRCGEMLIGAVAFESRFYSGCPANSICVVPSLKYSENNPANLQMAWNGYKDAECLAQNQIVFCSDFGDEESCLSSQGKYDLKCDWIEKEKRCGFKPTPFSPPES